MSLMSVKILRGVDLIGSNSYCEIYIDGKKVSRTPVQSHADDAVWGGPISTCEFFGDKKTEISVRIMQLNNFVDSKRGQVTFNATAILDTIKKDKYPNVWLPVQSLDGCDASGKLQVRVMELPQPEAAALPTAKAKKGRAKKNDLRESALPTLQAGPKLKGVGMCKTTESLKSRITASRCPVTIHVYDVSNDSRVATFNHISKHGLRGGIFHAAVEVYGKEFSFGGSRQNTTGVFACQPRKCPMHHYYKSFFLGDCDLSIQEVDRILQKMKPEWMAPTYDLFRKNCCNFSKEFAIELGVGSIPEWIYSLADMAASIDDYRKKREQARLDREAAREEKKSSTEPVPGPRPCRVEFSDNASGEEGVEVTDVVGEIDTSPPETGTLDDIMAAKMQRAYRKSMAVKKHKKSMAAGAGPPGKQAHATKYTQRSNNRRCMPLASMIIDEGMEVDELVNKIERDLTV